MKPPTLTKLKIRNLRSHLLDRRFAVPKLQRNFVWDARHAAKLLDSIYCGMPIGSLFLWEMDRKSANLIRQSAEVLPLFNSSNKDIWFVIDGQQRLSVIHQAFEAQVRQNDAGRDIDFGRLCFVVNPDRAQENPPRVVYRKPDDLQLVPIRNILAMNWRARIGRDRSARFLKKIRDCRERLLNYPVPVVIVSSATLDEIGEVFIRINSQGMRITSADRAIALMGKLDLRAMAQELRSKVREGSLRLGSIDPILMGFNLIAERPALDGDPPKLEAMARRWSKRLERDKNAQKEFRKTWARYKDAFLKAADYLHQRFPVHDESYLPSANMLATLAVFFLHHAGQPNRQQAAEIRKWFWATGVAQRYSGRGYHANIASDATFFESLARGTRKRFAFTERLDPVIDIQGAEYASHSARARAFFCLLAANEPRYLDNGEPIPLGPQVMSHANRKHRHHIFPRGQLKNRLSPRIYNSLCNICFLVSHDNVKIGMKHPRRYLAEYRETSRRRFRQVMKSHLIPVGEESGVWDRGIVGAFKGFRQQRLELICKEFERQAGIKLFRKH
jgi:hypothetical protein